MLGSASRNGSQTTTRRTLPRQALPVRPPLELLSPQTLYSHCPNQNRLSVPMKLNARCANAPNPHISIVIDITCRHKTAKVNKEQLKTVSMLSPSKPLTSTSERWQQILHPGPQPAALCRMRGHLEGGGMQTELSDSIHHNQPSAWCICRAPF